jgi:hypothetical protein
VDEGRPVSYLLLARSTPVYASGGEVVGRVRKVLCEPAADIFDGLELDGVDGRRYVPAEHVASIHERGVDERLPATRWRNCWHLLIARASGGTSSSRRRTRGTK